MCVPALDTEINISIYVIITRFVRPYVARENSNGAAYMEAPEKENARKVFKISNHRQIAMFLRRNIDIRKFVCALRFKLSYSYMLKKAIFTVS